MSEGRRRRRARRTVSAEERRLWNSVARTAEPLEPKGQKTAEPDPPAAPLVDPRVAEPSKPAPPVGKTRSRAPEIPKPPARKPRAPSVSVTRLPEEVGPVGKPEPGLDRRTSDRLRRGHRDPDARIDLHGMTADRAHAACLTFLSSAVARGLRVVLVITGKGGRHGAGEDAAWMRSNRGVLRDSLPGWLRASPLGRQIVGIYEANPRHGGSGAFYIYLKKRR